MNSENKICQSCKQKFVIEPDDFAFYEKMKVPAPTFCSYCREQRRLAWRNESAFYKRSCDLCNQEIISLYPAGTPFPVYCRSCWYSDKWDALDYGRDYDFSKPFFQQFYELLNVVPRIALQQDNCIDCDYTNQIANCKHCYLVSSCAGSENCYFGFRINDSKEVLDSYTLIKCEQCYELAMGRYSSRIFFSQGVADSFNLYFCDEPRGVENSFMSTNLRRASHVFRNKQLTREEYEKKIKEIDFGSYKTIEKLKKEFFEMSSKSLHACGTFKNVVNTTGNALANTSNCHHCFHGTNLENCRFCLFVDRAKDCMDANNGCCTMELCYECSTVGIKAFNIKFSVDAWPDVRDLEHCDSCRSDSKDLFGCISARRKQYCILNKQYNEKEYKILLDKIKLHMDETPYVDAGGRSYRYGEFFPVELSPFPYSDSSAQDFYPLSQKEAESLRYPWKPIEKRDYKITLPADRMPDNIKDVTDDIFTEIIGCSHEGRCNERCTTAFRISSDELSFYRQMNLPLPRLCPNCRHYERIKQRNPLKLWHRKCMKPGCKNEFETSYAPDRPEIVYCESCYNSEVA